MIREIRARAGLGAVTESAEVTASDVSIIMPVGGQANRHLGRSLKSIRDLDPSPGEVIVALDGPDERARRMAVDAGAIVVESDTVRGPAAARNHGARGARGTLLFFVDADVELPPDIVGDVVGAFNRVGDLEALMGSYDRSPADPSVISQFRNLLHHFVHQRSRREASTFWGACGVVRRAAFESVGGFDERYAKPSIEDIEFGRRLHRDGRRIHLAPELQVKHLKSWRLGEMIRTDLLRRALPWTRLLLAEREAPNDLNLSTRDRFSVVLAWLIPPLAGAAVVWPGLLLVGGAAGMVILILNRDLFGFFARTRGLAFTGLAMPLYWLYLLVCGAGFAAGLVSHLVRPWRLRGA